MSRAGTGLDVGWFIEEKIKRIFLIKRLALMERQKSMKMRSTGLMKFFRNDCGAYVGKHFMCLEEGHKVLRSGRIIGHIRCRKEKMFIIK